MIFFNNFNFNKFIFYFENSIKIVSLSKKPNLKFLFHSKIQLKNFILKKKFSKFYFKKKIDFE